LSRNNDTTGDRLPPFGCVINAGEYHEALAKECGPTFQSIARAGFDTTDTGGSVDMENGGWLEAAGRGGRRIRAAGLRVVAYHSVLLMSNLTPEANGALQELHMHGARTAGCSMFIVHSRWENFEPFDFLSRRLWGDYLDFDIAHLLEVSRRCQRVGLRLVIENNPLFPLGYYEDLFREIPIENAGFLLDTGHANIQTPGFETPLTDWIERLGGRHEHLHLHDNDGRNDRHIPILAAGGNIDWQACFRALKATGYSGVINEELPPMTGIERTRWALLERGAAPLRELWASV